jgi:hypothetical protein
MRAVSSPPSVLDMDAENEDTRGTPTNGIAIGIALGLPLGVALGMSVLDNLALGLLFGTSIGLTLGVAIDTRRTRGHSAPATDGDDAEGS